MEAVWSALAAGATLVTGNRRLARDLRQAFNERQRDAGRAAWPTPAIHPWEDWLRLLWQARADLDGDTAPGLLTPGQAACLWGQVATGDLSGTSAAAAMAERAHELCSDWEIDPALLERVAAGADARLFADWRRAYLARLERHGLKDAAGALAALRADDRLARLAPARHVLLAGPDDWPPARRALVARLAALGATVTRVPMPSVAPKRRVRFRCRDRADELDTAARFARAVVESDPGARVGVVVGDLDGRLAEVRRAFLDVTAPHWRLAPAAPPPVNFSLAAPVVATGIAHAALLTLRLLGEGLDYREAAAWLRSPWVGEHSREAAGRGRAEFALREQAGLSTDVASLAAVVAPTAPLLAARLQRLRALRESLPRRQRLAAWLPVFREALEAAGWPGDRPLASDEFQAFEAWWRLGDGLRECDDLAGATGLGEALGFLQRAGEGRPFQPAGSGQRIQVLGVLEALGQSFDAIWVTGLTATEWPPAARPTPLVPLELQRRAGVPGSTPASLLAQARERLAALLDSAPLAVVSAPAFDGDEPISASPLADALPEAEAGSLGVWTGLAPWRVEPAPLATSTDRAPALSLPARVRGGTGMLERQSGCPARAFLQDRLGASELPRPSPGIDNLRRGRITHRALADFWSKVGDATSLRRMAPDERAGLIAEVLDAAIAREVPLAGPLFRRLVDIERVRQRQLLDRFLEGEAGRGDFRVLVTEGAPGGQRLPPAVAALALRMRVDRLDELADGWRIVLDYKTGGRPPSVRQLFETRLPAPQLPLYAIASGADAVAWIRLAGGEATWAGTGHDDVTLEGIRPPGKVRGGRQADWDGLREHWWHTLDRLAQEFTDGDFRINHWNRAAAKGQWAMATRVHDLAAGDDEDAEGDGA